MPPLELEDGLDAFLNRHQDICDDDVDGPVPNDANSVPAVGRSAHAVARAGEKGLEQLSKLAVVLDDEYVGHGDSLVELGPLAPALPARGR